MNDVVSTSVEAVAEDRRVTCWVKDCSVPARWILQLSRPILGAPLIALCDTHLDDFEHTSALP